MHAEVNQRNSRPSVKYEPTVKDLMTPEPFTLCEDDNVRVLEELMAWRNIRHVPVVSQGGELVGLVTHRDFLGIAISQLAEIKQSEVNRLYEGIKIGMIMKKKVASVMPETPLHCAAEIMVKNKYGCLIVVNGSKVTGIITEADFVRAFFEWDARFTMANPT